MIYIIYLVHNSLGNQLLNFNRGEKSIITHLESNEKIEFLIQSFLKRSYISIILDHLFHST